MNCATCIHWNKLERLLDSKGNAPHIGVPLDENNRAGECRCKPPVSVMSNGGGFRAFPITRAIDSCGEWENVPNQISPPKRGRPKKNLTAMQL